MAKDSCAGATVWSRPVSRHVVSRVPIVWLVPEEVWLRVRLLVVPSYQRRASQLLNGIRMGRVGCAVYAGCLYLGLCLTAFCQTNTNQVPYVPETAYGVASYSFLMVGGILASGLLVRIVRKLVSHTPDV